jgi:hypothetical protein
MTERIGYVVACTDRAGQAEDSLPSRILHFDLADAEFERDVHADKAEELCSTSRYIVCELTEARDD